MKALFKHNPLVLSTLFAILVTRIIMMWLAYAKGLATLEPDSHDYMRLAINLVEHGVFGDPGRPEIFRVPGYPAILAICTVILGSNALGLVLLLQLIADMISSYCVYKLLSKTLTSRIAVLGAILCWGSFGLMAYSQRLLSESIFTALFIGSLYTYIKYKHRPIASAALAGLGLGVLCYFRALALPLAALVGVYFFLICKPKQGCIALLLWAICIAPWVVRNMAVANFANFSSSSAITFYRYHAAALAAKQNTMPFAEQQHIHTKRLNALSSQTEQAAFAQSETRRIIAGAPFTYSSIHIKNSIANLFPLSGEWLRQWGVKLGGNNTLDVLNNRGVLPAVKAYCHDSWITITILFISCVTWGGQLCLALIGWMKLFNTNRHIALFLLACFLLFLGITGPDSHPRFRVPMLPFIAALTALGAANILNPLKKATSCAASQD